MKDISTFLFYPLNIICDGLVSLFNGISTFLGYSMPKPFSLKNISDNI